MKTKIMLIITLVAAMLATSYAEGRDWKGKPYRYETRFERSLNYQQRAAINQIELWKQKASKPLFSKLNKLESRHNSLINKRKPNLNKINANIYEIEQVKSQLARIEAKSRVDILSLLDRNQKRLFAEYEKTHRQSFYSDRRQGRQGRHAHIAICPM
ncbi:hypothetical protein [Massilibacteroides vaginae]|uniref:hypothetical protein n=1 Tax=Massilibacteroides vaginae TaxID=1673718 RepID=UPI000A1C83DF|nr:hypothetical protein [Massilibacteroides vaginae]